ncbi:tetratricopeptide repeat protein [Accumulibacter sp.]|uniref:tetratricopeptide repeat protein n=1 Tax=Accumulibacter sp. TaxID=2053492 RepID=UPI00261C52DC|nr:tetratricopeptide repeat protein [Accumulibacter sp.]
MSAFARPFAVALSMAILGNAVQALPLAAPNSKSQLNDIAPVDTGAAFLPALPADLHSNPSTRLPPEILRKLGRGEDSQGLRNQGLELKRRLDQKPGDPYLMHALATIMFHEGNQDEARALWAAASRREPNLASAELMAAVQGVFVALAGGERDAAGKQLAAIEKNYARDPHFQLIRAEQAMQARNAKAAERAYRRAYELAPQLYVTSLNLARFLDLARNDAPSAERMYAQAARLAAARPEVWNNYGVFLLRQNRADDALAAFRQVKSLDASAPVAEKQLGDLCTALGRYEEARRWYVAARALKPSAGDEQALRLALGDVLLRLARYDDARREIEAALQVQELPQLVFALGTIDEAEGKIAAAEARYRQTLKLAPGNPLAANNLAMLLVKANRGAAEALKLVGEARRAIPDNAIIEGTWGCVLMVNGRPGEAAKVLETVTKAVPDDAWVRYCLGKSLLAEKRSQAAAVQFKEVLQRDAHFPRRDEVSRLIAAAAR